MKYTTRSRSQENLQDNAGQAEAYDIGKSLIMKNLSNETHGLEASDVVNKSSRLNSPSSTEVGRLQPLEVGVGNPENKNHFLRSL